MKIGYGPPLGAGTNAGAAAKIDRSAKDARVRSLGSTPEVSVSSEARAKAIQGASSFDSVRVERLRSARETGSLSLDTAAVAKRLAEEN